MSQMVDQVKSSKSSISKRKKKRVSKFLTLMKTKKWSQNKNLMRVVKKNKMKCKLIKS
jgi:hypothetical protein